MTVGNGTLQRVGSKRLGTRRSSMALRGAVPSGLRHHHRHPLRKLQHLKRMNIQRIASMTPTLVKESPKAEAAEAKARTALATSAAVSTTGPQIVQWRWAKAKGRERSSKSPKRRINLLHPLLSLAEVELRKKRSRRTNSWLVHTMISLYVAMVVVQSLPSLVPMHM